jgi:hypothetical protein
MLSIFIMYNIEQFILLVKYHTHGGKLIKTGTRNNHILTFIRLTVPVHCLNIHINTDVIHYCTRFNQDSSKTKNQYNVAIFKKKFTGTIVHFSNI